MPDGGVTTSRQVTGGTGATDTFGLNEDVLIHDTATNNASHSGVDGGKGLAAAPDAVKVTGENITTALGTARSGNVFATRGRGIGAAAFGTLTTGDVSVIGVIIIKTWAFADGIKESGTAVTDSTKIGLVVAAATANEGSVTIGTASATIKAAAVVSGLKAFIIKI